MSDRRALRAVACCLFALIAAGSRAGAQSGGTPPVDPLASHRYAVRIARLAYDSAVARANADSLRRMSLPVIRTYAGLQVRADTTNVEPAVLRALDSTFAGALAESRALFGPVADSLLAGVRVSIAARYETADLERVGGMATHVTVQYDGAQGGGYAVVKARPVDAAALTDHFVMWFGRAAGLRLPQAFKGWTPLFVPVRSNDAIVNRSAYIRLATHISPIARACLDGSHFGCRASLAIVPGGDTVGVWLDAAGRRNLARDRIRDTEYRRWPSARRCLLESSDADCRDVIRARGIPSPTIGEARQSLIRRALIKGGSGAYSRLLASPSNDIVTLLETASGVPLDSLTDAWRTDVLAARSPSPAPDGKELGISLVVGIFSIALATRRRP